jgi:hypothetical protein
MAVRPSAASFATAPGIGTGGGGVTGTTGAPPEGVGGGDRMEAPPVVLPIPVAGSAKPGSRKQATKMASRAFVHPRV